MKLYPVAVNATDGKAGAKSQRRRSLRRRSKTKVNRYLQEVQTPAAQASAVKVRSRPSYSKEQLLGQALDAGVNGYWHTHVDGAFVVTNREGLAVECESGSWASLEKIMRLMLIRPILRATAQRSPILAYIGPDTWGKPDSHFAFTRTEQTWLPRVRRLAGGRQVEVPSAELLSNLNDGEDAYMLNVAGDKTPGVFVIPSAKQYELHDAMVQHLDLQDPRRNRGLPLSRRASATSTPTRSRRASPTPSLSPSPASTPSQSPMTPSTASHSPTTLLTPCETPEIAAIQEYNDDDGQNYGEQADVVMDHYHQDEDDAATAAVESIFSQQSDEFNYSSPLFSSSLSKLLPPDPEDEDLDYLAELTMLCIDLIEGMNSWSPSAVKGQDELCV